jgi:hypothetical protein
MKSLFAPAIICIALIVSAPSALNGDIVTIVDNNLNWQSFTSELADEEAFDFGLAPTGQNDVANINRIGTGNQGTSFAYEILNRDTLTEINNTDLIASAGGTLNGFFLDVNATLDVETPASQGGATSTGWGVDSSGTGNNTSVGGIASRNAVVFNFGSEISAFSADLIDFESSNGQEGLLVLSLAGNVIHTEDISFADSGNGSIHNFGILATDGQMFDAVMFVLGDDNDSNPSNGYGGAEQWSASNFKVGFAAAVPEPNSMLLIGLCGITACVRRRRN